MHLSKEFYNRGMSGCVAVWLSGCLGFNVTQQTNLTTFIFQ